MVPYRIILVRHGETDWNKKGRYLGQSDPGLNETGVIQAQTVADIFKNEKIDLIFSSDLQRAVQTSRVIAAVHNVPVRTIPFLREINFGDWEGLTFDEIQACYPLLVSEWLEDPLGVRIPGGETAEEFRVRVIEAWNNIVADSADKKAVVIVAHGGPLRMLWCHLTGADLSRQWEFNLGHGESSILVRSDDKCKFFKILGKELRDE